VTTTANGAPRSFSVVIPAHNAGDTLREQVDALRQQDSAALMDVVVVDSMSTDDTVAVVERLRASWPKVRLVTATRSGANAARNQGVEASAADGVLMCDADDVVGDAWVSSLTSALHDNDVVRGRYSLDRLNGPDLVAARGPLPSDEQIASAPLMGGLGGCCAFRRTSWERLGGLNEAHYGADDMEFFWRAQISGLRVAYVPAAVVHYRLRSDPRSLYVQQRQWASSRALLFKEFGQLGAIRRRTLRAAVKSWGWTAVHASDRWSEQPRVQGRWVRVHAHNVGNLRGSLRHRVLYP
jgi:cellulose synthase/poly-beta-1,6-N-acetylglucosamine synthase-like glycosyltransferase